MMPAIGALAGFAATPLGRTLAAAAGGLAVLMVVYGLGYRSAAEKCEAAALRQQVEQLRYEIVILRDAEALAERQAKAASFREATLNQRIDDYEAQLATDAGADGACLLTDADVDRLRQLSR